jgi:hypothetical protein
VLMALKHAPGLRLGFDMYISEFVIVCKLRLLILQKLFQVLVIQRRTVTSMKYAELNYFWKNMKRVKTKSLVNKSY